MKTDPRVRERKNKVDAAVVGRRSPWLAGGDLVRCGADDRRRLHHAGFEHRRIGNAERAAEDRPLGRQQLLLLQQQHARPRRRADQRGESRRERLPRDVGDDQRLRHQLAGHGGAFQAGRRRVVLVRPQQQRRLQHVRQALRRGDHDGLQPVPDPSAAVGHLPRVHGEEQRDRAPPRRRAGVLHVVGVRRQARDDRAARRRVPQGGRDEPRQGRPRRDRLRALDRQAPGRESLHRRQAPSDAWPERISPRAPCWRRCTASRRSATRTPPGCPPTSLRTCRRPRGRRCSRSASRSDARGWSASMPWSSAPARSASRARASSRCAGSKRSSSKRPTASATARARATARSSTPASTTRPGRSRRRSASPAGALFIRTARRTASATGAAAS